MKITDVKVDGFGVWKGLNVEALSDDMTVFCGHNEAGKTTFMQFVRSMMFGFSPDRLDKYTPPVYGGLAGGLIDIDTSTGKYEVQRHVDPNRHSDPIGDLSVINNHDGSVHGNSHLRGLMSDVDESIFNNVFAIGLREIQELNALNSTAAAEQLYRLTSGLDRVSLVDVMRDLKNRRTKIWSTNAKNESRMQQLSDRRSKLLREIDELKQRSKRWSRIAAESNDVTHELTELEQKLTATERESRLIEIATQISDRWQKRHIVIDQIRGYNSLPDEKLINAGQLDQFNEKIEVQHERINQIKGQRKSIKSEAMALPVSRSLWSQKSRIEAISEHAPWIESLERQTESIDDQIKGIENSLVGEIDGLGHQLQIKARDVHNLDSRALLQLEATGKKLYDQREKLKSVKDNLEKTEFDLGQHSQRLGTSMSAAGATESLEETGRYVARLRRRVELEDKIEKLNRNRIDLERDIDDVVNDQVLPVNKLSIIGIVFILGFVLLGFGILGSLYTDGSFTTSNKMTGFLLIVMGAVAGLVSMGMKYHWERMAKDELDDFRHQMDIIRQQLKRAKHERDEIERQLPMESISQFDLELNDAEGRLNQLEELVPLENRVKSTKAMLEDLRRQIDKQEREVGNADGHWRTSLRSSGLPEVLEPEQLHEISQRSERISVFHTKLEQLKNEKEDKEKELHTIRRRIDGMLSETQISFESDRLTDRLTRISSVIDEQRSHVVARKELATKYKSLRARLTKAKLELERLETRKQRLFSAVGVETEESFRQFAAQHRDRKKLLKQKSELTEQIGLALGKKFVEQDIRTLFESYGAAGLEKRWESVLESIEEIREQQGRLLQQRGELANEVKLLGEDSRLDEARLELNSIETEVTQLQRQWQELAASTQMLELIRETYESKRQPETLKEASGYLLRLSEGRYTRIWTRLTGEELLVDNEDDETISVDKLSRGTREAVYLSLRLALVGAYARRGAVIPMVLDDVLVNFDGQRAYAAAELLYDFSRNGYQILMFTCHNHMRDMFHQLGADVRILPEHKDVFESGAVPVRYDGTIVAPPKPIEAIAPVVPTIAVEPEPAAEVFSVSVNEFVDPEPVSYDQQIPVEYIQPRTSIDLDPNEYDRELEYELSAITDVSSQDRRLRHEMVYQPVANAAPTALPQAESVWWVNEPAV